MFWIEQLIGVDLGIWSWIGDFALLSVAIIWWLDSDAEQRWAIAVTVLFGVVVFAVGWVILARIT